MKQDPTGADEFINTLVQHRQVLLKHTAELLCADDGPVRQAPVEREAKLSAILVSSLEQLKVAEEELMERSEALADLRHELEQHVRGAHELFDLAPACLLVTDLYGTIVEANRAIQLLLKQDFASLERQPFARFIPADERRAFREGLARIAATNGVTDWRLSLVRPTDAPLTVSAAARVVSTVGATSGTKLFWSMRPFDPADLPMDA
jgi:PAS domain-containing protein